MARDAVRTMSMKRRDARSAKKTWIDFWIAKRKARSNLTGKEPRMRKTQDDPDGFFEFVCRSFRFFEGEKLAYQVYVYYVCMALESFAKGRTRRLLINLPPGSLKTFMGSICLAS